MGPRGVAAIVCFVALLAPATASGGTFSGTYTSARYGWDWFSLNGYATADCGNKQPFTGREPDAAGTFPVLLYVPDTTNLHDGRAAQAFLAAAADAGFVAVSAKMTENLFHAAGVDANAMCIASGSRPGSVASQVCARPKADCSKGMVVAGFSQGAVIALRARNHDARVRAAYLIGINEERTTESGARWRTSMPPPTGTRALANNQVRIVNGEGDSTVARRDD